MQVAIGAQGVERERREAARLTPADGDGRAVDHPQPARPQEPRITHPHALRAASLHPLPQHRRDAPLDSVRLATLMAWFPFPVRTIQVDGASEWMAGFEVACQARGIALWVLPPRKPQGNDCVERLNRTGREAGALWVAREGYANDLDLPIVGQALRAWERESNMVRPHQSLGMRTPAAFLALRLSATS